MLHYSESIAIPKILFFFNKAFPHTLHVIHKIYFKNKKQLPLPAVAVFYMLIKAIPNF